MKLVFSLLVIFMLTACSPTPDNITKNMINEYIKACEKNGGIIDIKPGNWIWYTKVKCSNGAYFFLYFDKVVRD